MKELLKRIIPEILKRKLREIENILIRLTLGSRYPVILTDEFDVKFILDPNDRNPIRWQLEAGTNTPEFLQMQKRIQPGDMVFDVGANIGLVSVYASKRTGETGAVHAFEPHPTTSKELHKTVALNECTNVHINQVALSSSIGTHDFYYVPNHKLSSLGPIADKTYGENQVMQVPTTTIDAYCKAHNIDHINFLKIDVEGFELDVLQGATQMLSDKAIFCIQFEMHHKDSTLINLLRTYGYTIDHADGFNQYATLT